MVLVAIAMVAIIAIAALSIDVITLYLAREEAQRSADTAALAAARVISVSGMTGDPSNSAFSWQAICGPGGAATQAATAVATQSAVGGTVANTVLVTYSAGGQTGTDCTAFTAPGAFSVNPMVTVKITRTSLPTFFSRIWGYTGNTVSASATAEAFNPSASDLNSNGPAGTVTPVQPSCVKPWVVPNMDPLNPSNCTTNCTPFVSATDGSIMHGGISTGGGSGLTGVIGENFWLAPGCSRQNPGNCTLHQAGSIQPQANYTNGNPYLQGPPNLLYVPGQVGVNPVVAVPTCAQGDAYQQSIGGCDSPLNYQCGVQNANIVDLSTENPSTSGDTTTGVLCLTNQQDRFDVGEPTGQDYFNPFAKPNPPIPFQILAGSHNALSATLAGTPISSSTSIVSLPIYDDGMPHNSIKINSASTTNATFVGFLQVFINAVDQYGNVNVTVLNVAGCGNGNGAPVGSTPVGGTSPVPIRLITPQ
jgi:hypothetical protein